jgi:hypothetical protein
MSFLTVICTNLLPIGTYLCVLGLLHAAGRPLVTTSLRDYLALAIALAGLVVNGPIDVVLHSRMLPDFLERGPWFGLVIYVVLVAALAPRGYESLVVYNCSESSVGAAVRTILQRVGSGFQEVPGGWILAGRGVSLEIDSFPVLNNVTLCLRGMRDRELYRQIQLDLPELLAEDRPRRSAVGLLMAVAGGMVLALPVWILARNPHAIADALRQAIETW